MASLRERLEAAKRDTGGFVIGASGTAKSSGISSGLRARLEAAKKDTGGAGVTIPADLKTRLEAAKKDTGTRKTETGGPVAMPSAKTPGESRFGIPDAANISGALDRAAETRATYYSPEDLYGDADYLYADIADVEGPLLEKQRDLERAAEMLGTLYERMESGSAGAQEINAYNALVGQYGKKYEAFSKNLDVYNKTVNAYGDYLNDQGEKYDRWKATVRDSAAIEADIAAIDAQLAEIPSAADDWRKNIFLAFGASSETGQTTPLYNNSGARAPLQEERARLQEELGWARYLESAEVMKNEDFEEKSGYVPTGTGEREMNILGTIVAPGNDLEYHDSGYDDLLYEWINGNEEAGERYRAELQKSGNIGNGALGAVWSTMTDGEWQAQEMSEDEVKIFNYIYATQGKEAAHEYYEHLRKDFLNQRLRKKKEEQAAAYARENKVGASLGTVIMSPFKTLSYAEMLGDYISSGEVDQNAPYNMPVHTISAARNAVAENWGPVGSTVYQLGMSFADSMYAGLLSGSLFLGAAGGVAGAVSKATALAIMGTGAAADMTVQAKDRGLSDDQAFALGAVAGAAEIVMEKIGLDELLKSAGMGKGAVSHLARVFVANGGEEVGTDAINLFADIIISQDESEWRKSIEAYMANGDDETTAFWKAFGDQALAMGVTFIGGGFMAGAPAAINVGVSTAAQKLGGSAGTTQSAPAVEGVTPTAPTVEAPTLSVLEQAVSEAASKGAVTNSIAERVMADPAAMAELGIDTNGKTRSQTRQAVKSALEALGGNSATSVGEVLGDTSSTASGPPSPQGEGFGETVSEGDTGTAIRMWNGETVSEQEYAARYLAANPDKTAEDAQQFLRQVRLLKEQHNIDPPPFAAAETGTGATEITGIPNAAAAAETRNSAVFGGVEGISEEAITEGPVGIDREASAQAVPGVRDLRNASGGLRLESPFTDEDMQYMEEIAQAAGVVINIVEASESADGWYENGQIFIPENTTDPVMEVAKHEVTHHLKRTAPKQYAEYLEHVKAVLTEEGTLEAQLQAVKQGYAEKGVELTDEGALDEVAANFTERLLIDRDMFRRVTQENRGLAQRLLNSLKEFIRKVRNALSRHQLTELEQAQAAWEAMLKESRGKTVEADGQRQYLFAGKKARTANFEALVQAQMLANQGADNETVRQETGWFRGADGQWRFEIDDRGMEYHPGSGAVLADLIDHPLLFQAYPELENMPVEFAELDGGTKGEFTGDRIVLDESLRNADMDTLIHEIQHAIQRAEGFAGGSSPEYWRGRMEGGYSKRWNSGEEMMPTELYENTAGEIEARDTAKRRTMTAQQRRETRPDLGDENTVFAEGTVSYNAEVVPFRQQIDDVLDGKTSSETTHLNMGKTPDLYSEFGFDTELDILVTAKHIKSMNAKVQAGRENAHDLSRGKIAGLPRKLADPVIVMVSKTNPDCAVVVTDTLNAKKEPVIVALKPDGTGNYMNAEVVANIALSGYGKEHFDRYLTSAFSDGRMLFCDYAKSRQLQQTPGVQFPNNLPRGDFTDNVAQFAARVKANRAAKQAAAADKRSSRQNSLRGIRELEEQAAEQKRQSDRLEEGNMLRREMAKLRDMDHQTALLNSGGMSALKENEKKIKALERRLNKLEKRPDEIATMQKKKTKPVAKSLPSIAKKDLRQNLLGLFSVPEGTKAEAGAVINRLAERMLKNGSLTEQDRTMLFDYLYNSGVVTLEADEYYQIGREAVKGGRVYVSERDKGAFGDEWNAFRKRAFAAGVYLTNERGDNGIDSWNAELAESLPGLFDPGATNNRAILERIVQVAEDGKAKNVSLAEYTAQLAGQEYISEEQVLDDMERQMDWALRTFAEKARLEVGLRDRTGVKLAEERQARHDAIERQRQDRELRELQQKTLKQLQWLSKNRHRAPEELKATWDEVLGDIDIYAVGAANELNWSKKYNASWRDLAQMYKTAKENDPNFMPSEELERIVTRLDGDKIADMDIGALQDLYKAAVGIRTEFYNRNRMIGREENAIFAEIFMDAKQEIEAARGRYKGNWADWFVNLQQLTPMNVLERIGGWNPDGAFYSMAKQLEKGERAVRDYKVRANAMMEEFLTERADWVKKADGQGKDAVWYEIEVPELLELGMGDKPIFGDTKKVYMTPAQKVHLYLESKNTDNLRHMMGGRTFVNRELYSKGKRKEAFAQGVTIKLAPETVKRLVSDLTAEEMELAQVLERYYNEFASERINVVSRIISGFDKAIRKFYAPIYTNESYTGTQFGVIDSKAENVGRLKGRIPYSKTPSYNLSALDAFERHVDQTSRYVGMAIPTRNWTSFLNWSGENTTTKDMIAKKWGQEGVDYIKETVNRLQKKTQTKKNAIGVIADKLLGNYISSTFAFNLSIVFKQFGSVCMAAPELGIRNVPALAKTFGKKDYELIGKYTSELAWRGMGYSTPETKQLKDNPNWTQTVKPVKFLFGGGAITAADQAAAGVLWPWAENKVRRENPDLEVGTQEQIDAGQSPFYKKVAEVFNDAVNRSQSASDEMHQSALRKSEKLYERAATMFKSDSAQGYNQLRQKIGEARFYARSGADAKTVRRARRAAGEAVLGILANNAWSAGISFLFALWRNGAKYYRDDEDELTAGSVLGEMAMTFVGNLAGLIAGGEGLAEVIGNLVTGDKWYGIDAPGFQQMEEIFELLDEKGKGAVELVKGGADIVKNGGDLGKYFQDNLNGIIGGVKDLAMATATYFAIPVNNMEAYLLGLVRWASPGLATAYEDAMATVNKDDLSGLSGEALVSRTATIMERRLGEIKEETVEKLASLYEEGCKTAVPSNLPDRVTVNGEEVELAEHQKQFYDTVWKDRVAGTIDELVASEPFAEADAEVQAKMLSKLYSYAAAKAKKALFADYEPDAWVTEADEAVGDGESMAEWIAWEVLSADVSANFSKFVDAGFENEKALEMAEELSELEPEPGVEDVSTLQKYKAIADMPLGEDDMDMAMEAIMSDSAYKKYRTARDAGVSTVDYCWFLECIADITGDGKKERIWDFIDSMDLTDKQKDAMHLAAGYKETTLSKAPWN